MAVRCSYRDEEGGRCYRNGSGNPPLCRSHALVVLAEQEGEVPDWLQIGIDMIDRKVSQSRDPLVRGIRERLGSFFSDMAGATNAGQVGQQAPPGQAYYTEAPPPPPREKAAPPPPPKNEPEEDPRTVLGFPPGSHPTKEEIKTRQRDLAKLFHPDRGGSTEAMRRVNDAASRLLASL